MSDLIYWTGSALLVLATLLTARSMWNERWRWQALAPTALALLMLNYWWWWGGFRTIHPFITIMGDLTAIPITLIVIEKWVGRWHYRGPLMVVATSLLVWGESFASLWPNAGLRAQERVCRFEDISDEGHLILGPGRELTTLLFVPPTRGINVDDKGQITEPELLKQVLALVRQATTGAKILLINRPTSVEPFITVISELWDNASRDANPKLWELFQQLELILQPHLLERRNIHWPLAIATMVIVVIERNDDLEEELVASGQRSGFKVDRLDTYRLVALWRGLTHHEVLNLDAETTTIETTTDLRDTITPDVYSLNRHGVVLTTKQERAVHHAFATISMTGETEIGAVTAAAARMGLDAVISIKPLDPHVEAERLMNLRKRTVDDEALVADYFGGSDLPISAKIELVVHADDPGYLEGPWTKLCRKLTAHYKGRGVIVRPIRGALSVEKAFHAWLPTLDSVPSASYKLAASDLQPCVIGVGEHEVRGSSTAIPIGQTEPGGQLVFIDPWTLHATGKEERSMHGVIAGETGQGKTTLLKWMVLWEVLGRRIDNFVFVDCKALGDIWRLAESVCPSEFRLIRLVPDDPGAMAVLDTVDDEDKLFLVVESPRINEEAVTALAKALTWCWERYQRIGANNAHLTRLVCDEMAFYLTGWTNPVADVLELIVRRGISYGVRVWTASQDVADYIAAPETGLGKAGGNILGQSPLRICFRVEAEAVEAIHRFGFPMSIARQVPTFHPGRSALVDPTTNVPAVVDLWLSDELLRLLERRK